MLIAETLKKSILQAAIQGKLTQQLPSDGSAKDLLAKIKAEKQKLTAEGKIRREKTLAPITDDEKPFEIPENWEWVRLREIVFNRGQKKPDKIFSYIDIGSIDNDKQCLNLQETIIAPEKAPSRARKIVQIGDILYSTVRPYLHNMCVVDKEFSAEPIASTGFAALSCYEGLFNKYLFYYMLSPTFDDYANRQDNSKGVAYPAINDDKLYKATIPLPPLSEQKRIVDRVEELFAEIEKLEKDEKQLEELQKTFPSKLKNSLLQAAMQGKLTEQLPSDGNAKDLLDIIKKRTQIEDDEIPFDIPENWVWIKIADLCSVVNGFTPLRSNSEFWDKGTIPWFTVDDIHTQGRIIRATKQHITQKALSKDTSRVLPINTVVLCCTASVGEYALTKIPLTTNQQFNGLVIKENLCADIDANYLFSIAPTFKDRLLSIAGKTTFYFISVKKLNQLTIPLPPLAEQKRIVKKLEELLPLCEDLAE